MITDARQHPTVLPVLALAACAPMRSSPAISLAAAAALILLVALPGLALAERLLWLHTGDRVLGSINLDTFPELQGLCPHATWAEVKPSGTPGLFAYRCEDASWSWPFPTYGRSPALAQLWSRRRE